MICHVWKYRDDQTFPHKTTCLRLHVHSWINPSIKNIVLMVSFLKVVNHFIFVIFLWDFTIQPSDKVVAVGKPLLLNCQAQYSRSGTVHISWRNNGVWLLHPTNQPWTQLTNHSLYYSSIPAQSIGTFICGASVTGTNLVIYSRTAKVQAACKYFVSNYR